MKSSGAGLTSIEQPKVLLVEGKDEENFFRKLIADLELSDIEVRALGGTRKFREGIKTLTKTPGHERVTALGVVRDADGDASGSFQSVCDALNAAGYAVPQRPLEAAGENPKVAVMILPVGKTCGMLEDVCLMSVADDPAMKCVDVYFSCLADVLGDLPSLVSKAMTRAFLVSREILEESHFNYLQARLPEWVTEMPNPPTVEKTHLFLASRLRPHLDLGVAAQAGYWPLEHEVFEPIKEFLRHL